MPGGANCHIRRYWGVAFSLNEVPFRKGLVDRRDCQAGRPTLHVKLITVMPFRLLGRPKRPQTAVATLRSKRRQVGKLMWLKLVVLRFSLNEIDQLGAFRAGPS